MTTVAPRRREADVVLWDGSTAHVRRRTPPDDARATAVDQAVARTVACGGAVWVLAPDELPASPLPAAVLRY